ncbi:MAG: Integrin alpha beta-propellor repeat protein [Labilithrix sp.]|nr:Integrin alpha beta-propellor repeat protein [Labilithrix sp.]
MRNRTAVSAWPIAVAAIVALALAACSFIADLDTLSGGGDGDGGSTEVGTELKFFAVGGTARGLEGATVTLAVNGNDFVAVAGDGPFAFPQPFAPGAVYIATVLRPPEGHACTVTNGEGHVASADVTNIVVACPSTNTELTSLSLSTGPLSPAFSRAVTSYAAPATHVPFRGPSTIGVTATTASPGATITIDGAPAASGALTPTAIGGGANTIAVVVQAADGVTKKTYAVALVGEAQEAYVKASNARANSSFGYSIALSADGSTLAIGAQSETSAAIGIDGNQANTSASNAGAVYVFVRSGTTWTQQAYIKASNARAQTSFGWSVALSADGSTLAVGAYRETSAATGIDGDQASTSAANAGAAYLFTRAGTTWSQQAYVKASNARASSSFGYSVTLSADGSTLAVGAPTESSAAVGIAGNQADTSLSNAGAVYVFARSGTTWSQQAYVKASNTRANASFGRSVALSGDAGTLAVGANTESSAATGINGNQADTSAYASGAVYVFTRAGTWSQQAYVKASHPRSGSNFGQSVALSSDGATLAVGAYSESSAATGINGDETDTSAANAGAVYTFARSATTWSQQAYVKASNSRKGWYFGWSVALSSDGNALAVGAWGDGSNASGLNGNQADTSLEQAGAVYVFTRAGTWSQSTYAKASNPAAYNLFGYSVALSSDASTLAGGAYMEWSAATGINGNQKDKSAATAGAVYVFH